MPYDGCHGGNKDGHLIFLVGSILRRPSTCTLRVLGKIIINFCSQGGSLDEFCMYFEIGSPNPVREHTDQNYSHPTSQTLSTVCSTALCLLFSLGFKRFLRGSLNWTALQ